MLFKNPKHAETYEKLLSRVEANGYKRDFEVKPVMYLIALLSSDGWGNVADLMFNFAERKIRPGVIDADWQTGSTRRLTRLAFSLWNGFPSEEQGLCNVYNIFGNEWDPYFLQAIALRYS